MIEREQGVWESRNQINLELADWRYSERASLNIDPFTDLTNKRSILRLWFSDCQYSSSSHELRIFRALNAICDRRNFDIGMHR